MPRDTRQAIVYDALGVVPDRIDPVRGGDINQAMRVETGDARYFVKYKLNAPPGFFEMEALGLQLLQAAAEIRVPRVIRYAEAEADRPAYLALEWIDPAAPTHAFGTKFGRALAGLHRHQAASFGIDYDHLVNGLPQADPQAANWPAYYRDRRIVPQIERARRERRLPARRESSLDRIVERMDDLLSGLDSVPSLLHGDLWGGNYLCAAGDEPVLYDPHTYYGEREAEIAYTELFGGFPPGFYEAYQEAYPLDAGYEYRRPLHQLYHLLVHLNLFGEQYGPAVDAVCRLYA